MSFESLLSLATICNKYNTVSPCRPYIDEWLDQQEEYEFKMQTAWIYWVFGYTLKLNALVWYAVDTLSRDDQGRSHDLRYGIEQMKVPGLLSMLLFRFPKIKGLKECVDSVKERRTTVMLEITQRFSENVNTFIGNTMSCKRCGDNLEAGQLCHAWLASQLTCPVLDFLPSISLESSSAMRMEMAMYEIELKTYVDPTNLYHLTHKDCTRAAMRAVRKDIRVASSLSRRHYDYVVQQEKKRTGRDTVECSFERLCSSDSSGLTQL